MRLILIGPQGSGKGTQGARLAGRYGVPHVATGDLLRAERDAGTPLGARAESFMARGDLVPDDLAIEVLRVRLSREDAAVGFVLDGFPRTRAQAEALDATLGELARPLDAVVTLDVPHEVLLERMAGRGRADDTVEAIRRRLEVFAEQTAPLVSYYEVRGLVVHVDGVGEMAEIEERVAKALEAR